MKYTGVYVKFPNGMKLFRYIPSSFAVRNKKLNLQPKKDAEWINGITVIKVEHDNIIPCKELAFVIKGRQWRESLEK